MAKFEILGAVGGQSYSTMCETDQQAVHKARLVETEFRHKGGIWVKFERGQLRDSFGPTLVWFPSSSQVRITFDGEIPADFDAFS